jgi:hypothetical protein
VYIFGLGEFFFQNKIDPRPFMQAGLFHADEQAEQRPTFQPRTRQNRALIGVGGGKDSLVAYELLHGYHQDVTPFIVQTQKKSPLKYAVLEQMNTREPLVVERFLDEQLFGEIADSFNGHVPITAIVSSIATLAGLLYDYREFVLANEHSSNFGNVDWHGLEVNHQWSKSQAFETALQEYTQTSLTPNFRVFSLLRPFSELRIARMMSQLPQYFKTFSSCNHNFKVYKERTIERWCGDCPKCHFVFLMMAAFLDESDLLAIFDRNYFEDSSLESAFADLLGFGDLKPFECVGTFEEAQAALFLAAKKIPQYTNYSGFYRSYRKWR